MQSFTNEAVQASSTDQRIRYETEQETQFATIRMHTFAMPHFLIRMLLESKWLRGGQHFL